MNVIIIKINDFIEKIIFFVKNKFFLFFIILLFLSIFNIFKNIDIKQVNDWDEARYGVSAYEMLENKNFIVNTYLNEKDYWYLKPPLGIIFISLSYKIFGYSVGALRFPSAFSGLLIIILVVIICKYMFDNLTALLAGFILITSQGYLFDHAIREGNLDSHIGALILLSIICLNLINKNKLYFFLIAFISSIGFLIKSFAGLQVIIIFFIIYIIYRKNYNEINLKDFILFIVIFILPILFWLFLRYFYDGFIFIKKMIEYDLISRTRYPLEGHTGGFDYYFKILKNGMKKWFYFFYIIPVLFFLKIIKKDYLNLFLIDFNEKIIWIYTLVLLIILSIVKTKCYWYAIPVYPLLSILVAIYTGRYLESKYNFENKKFLTLFIFSKIFLIILFISYFFYNQIRITKEILSVNYSPGYEILLKIPDKSKNKNFFFYDIGSYTQANIFVIRVIKKLYPKLIEKNYKSIFLQNYIEKKEEGFLFLKKKELTQDEINYIKNNEKFIYLENREYFILKNFD